ncbi:hypothetical protein RND71_019704 [Anisodus tanguticus]|uniref:Uncharacterized protein n=1 Tax=Anisodus tanguticus TaxID=243964 RepID=A0AAE1S109_9SOLA|nr:hypothetical protein RND71_019704 [Anisodus tanguticus]
MSSYINDFIDPKGWLQNPNVKIIYLAEFLSNDRSLVASVIEMKGGNLKILINIWLIKLGMSKREEVEDFREDKFGLQKMGKATTKFSPRR